MRAIRFGDYNTRRPQVFGEHSAASIARSSGKWRDIPYLRENDGMLPPSVMVVGDRRRVLAAAELLHEGILLHEEVASRVGPGGSGRVNVAIGIYEHKGRPLPLTILETQMGMSPQDIIVWEALVNSREDGYMVNGLATPGDCLNVIRAGTCGGIILAEGGVQEEGPFIEIGDSIIAFSSLAAGTVAMQRMGYWSPFDPKEIAGFRADWAKEGLGFTKDGLWPIALSSFDVVNALVLACKEFGLTYHQGNNFSKDSLYMEGNEERLKDLRTRYGVLSTEMEHFGLAFIAHELTRAGIPTRTGLISTVVGTVPGGSFAAPGSEEEKRADRNTKTMLEATMHALWKLAYGS